MAGRPREFDRVEALDKAMELFWSRGYEATGISELTEHLGIGRQSLYGAFGSKRELFGEALAHYAATRQRQLIAILEGPGRGLDNLERVFEMWQQRAEAGPCNGCLVTNSVSELAQHDEVLAKTLDQHLVSVEEAFHTALFRAREQGDVDPGVDLRGLARHLTALSQGLALAGKVKRDASFTRDVVETARRLLRTADSQ